MTTTETVPTVFTHELTVASLVSFLRGQFPCAYIQAVPSALFGYYNVTIYAEG